MRFIIVAAVMLLAGCGRPRPLLTPEVLVAPGTVNYGSNVTVKLYDTGIASYRFMGAVPGPDEVWTVRLDPVFLGVWPHMGELGVKEGEILPLGPSPSINVEFVKITPSKLVLRAVSIDLETDQFLPLGVQE